MASQTPKWGGAVGARQWLVRSIRGICGLFPVWFVVAGMGFTFQGVGGGGFIQNKCSEEEVEKEGTGRESDNYA